MAFIILNSVGLLLTCLIFSCIVLLITYFSVFLSLTGGSFAHSDGYNQTFLAYAQTTFKNGLTSNFEISPVLEREFS